MRGLVRGQAPEAYDFKPAEDGRPRKLGKDERAKEMNLLEKIDKTISSMLKWPSAPDKHKDFLTSIRGQVIVKGKLSPAQIKWLENLQDKYGEAALVEERNWRALFDGERRNNVIKLMEYYRANPPFYQDLAEAVLRDTEGFIISAHAYNKLMENKFAKKVLAEYNSEPAFKVGEMAVIRKSNKVRLCNMHSGWPEPRSMSFKDSSELQNRNAIILEVHAKPITRAAKGSKVYKVLPVGKTPVYVHESDLKRARKTKSTRKKS